MGCEIRNIPCRYRARTRLIGNFLKSLVVTGKAFIIIPPRPESDGMYVPSSPFRLYVADFKRWKLPFRLYAADSERWKLPFRLYMAGHNGQKPLWGYIFHS